MPLPLKAEADQLAHLIDLVNSTNYDDQRYLTVLCGLGAETLRAFIALQTAFSQVAVNDTAWQARNLLELHIWTRYILVSEENAQRFYEDAWIDGNDLLASFSRHPGHETEIAEARKVSANSLPNLCFVDENDRFLRVGSVAKELGASSQFETLNKLYSKFVHVTSFAVLTRHSPQTRQKLVDSFETASTQMTKETLTMISEKLQAIVTAK
ncbi:MAG: hypothetical protein ABIR70_22250 [Bryobacteraceae bacterium]